jgi:hypothetical protein
MYECQGDGLQCQALQNSLDAVKRATDQLSKGSKDQQALAKTLGKILDFYGTAGVDNGVNVAFADLKGAAYATTHTSSFFGLFKSTTVTFDYHAFNHGYAFGAETAAHEGAHGVDNDTGAAGPRTTWYGRGIWNGFLTTETHAYQAEAAVDQGLGVRSASDGGRPVWDPSWGAAGAANSAAAVRANATANAVADCNAIGGCIGQP